MDRRRVGSPASAHATDTDFGAENVRSNPATVRDAFRGPPAEPTDATAPAPTTRANMNPVTGSRSIPSIRHRCSSITTDPDATPRPASKPASPAPRNRPNADEVRRALERWAFNTSARRSAGGDVPEEHARAMHWVHKHSPALKDIPDAARLRRMLDALALRLDGRPASSSTVARKRSALYSALQYAVETGALPGNPMDRIAWKAPVHTDVVDRRVVVNPDQAQALIDAVRGSYPSLEAFFACIYYAELRPAEVRHLRTDDLDLPVTRHTWGNLDLLGSTQTVGAAWTDSGQSTEDRALKHRARRATRRAPAPPELVEIIRRHLEQFQPGVDGRLFVNRVGRAGIPVAPPFAGPQSMGTVYRVWDRARRAVFTDAEYASPLAKRPYDLRHAAVALWLNAGVPATQVAEWAGHSVNVLLRVYASCIVGQDEAARRRVELALSAATGSSAGTSSPPRDGFPHDSPQTRAWSRSWPPPVGRARQAGEGPPASVSAGQRPF